MINIDLFKLEPKDLLDYLINECCINVPETINDVDDMEKASQLLLKLSANYSFLTYKYAEAELNTRAAKKVSKQDYERAIDQKKVISSMVDIVKQQYSAISRAVTIKIENNRELNMNKG